MNVIAVAKFDEIKRAMQKLEDDVGSKAMASTLNKTAAQAKTLMSREIREEFNISASDVSKRLRIRRASAGGGRISLVAALESENTRGRSINLAAFGARKTSKGVSFKVKRGGGRKTLPGSFLINNGKTVMIRTGKQRLPIRALQTINVSQMFNTKRINAKVVKFIEEKAPLIFANEAKYFTQRFNERK